MKLDPDIIQTYSKLKLGDENDVSWQAIIDHNSINLKVLYLLIAIQLKHHYKPTNCIKRKNIILPF